MPGSNDAVKDLTIRVLYPYHRMSTIQQSTSTRAAMPRSYDAETDPMMQGGGVNTWIIKFRICNNQTSAVWSCGDPRAPTASSSVWCLAATPGCTMQQSTFRGATMARSVLLMRALNYDPNFGNPGYTFAQHLVNVLFITLLLLYFGRRQWLEWMQGGEPVMQVYLVFYSVRGAMLKGTAYDRESSWMLSLFNQISGWRIWLMAVVMRLNIGVQNWTSQ